MSGFVVASPTEAEEALRYFNWFHDGFIKSLHLSSGDYFPEWGVQATTGDLRLDVLFAHYNYGEGRPGPGQRVRASFLDVKWLEMDLSGLAHEWSVDRLDLTGARRRNDLGDDEECLGAELWQHVLSEKREWQRARVFVWTFASAEFVEEP